MTILITGGKGYLGKVFTKVFAHKYHIINLGSADLDIRDKDAVLKTVSKHKPDIVLHFAAKAETKFCNENPDLAQAINVDGAVYVAEACKKIGVKMVFASTEQVYNGNTEDGPYTEAVTPVPNTVYGQNKYDAEKKILEVTKDVWILRFTWIFGLPEYGITPSENILTATVMSILKQKKISVANNEFRGMSYVYEIVNNLEKIFAIPFGTYHFGSNNPIERYEIVRHIFNLLATAENFQALAEKIPNPYGDKREIRLDNHKIAQQGIRFSESADAVTRCCKDFGYIKG